MSQGKAEAIHNLYKIQALGEMLQECAGNKLDLSDGTLTSVGQMLFELAEEAIDKVDVVEPKTPSDVKAPSPPMEADPLEKGKAMIALLRGNYDFLNSVITKSPEIKNQLKELQGEAAELMAKFDDLLIDLDYIPGEAPGPAA